QGSDIPKPGYCRWRRAKIQWPLRCRRNRCRRCAWPGAPRILPAPGQAVPRPLRPDRRQPGRRQVCGVKALSHITPSAAAPGEQVWYSDHKGAHQMRVLTVVLISLGSVAVYAQEASAPGTPKVHQVEAGRRIPLTMIRSVSTKSAAPGDPIYLETAFPVIVGDRIVIPRGSYVTGSVTDVKRAGKVKGR